MATVRLFKDVIKGQYVLYTGNKDLEKQYPGQLRGLCEVRGWNMSTTKMGMTHNWSTYNKSHLNKTKHK